MVYLSTASVGTWFLEGLQHGGKRSCDANGTYFLLLSGLFQVSGYDEIEGTNKVNERSGVFKVSGPATQ